MHWIADLLAAIGVVLNGIPQGIMAMGLGFAVFPTTFSFVLASAVNGAFGSVAPISFQAESLALTGNLGDTTRERTSIIFGGSLIMAVIGVSGTLTKIVAVLGNSIMAGMMAGVGIMLAKIAVKHGAKTTNGWYFFGCHCNCDLSTDKRFSLDHRVIGDWFQFDCRLCDPLRSGITRTRR